MEEYFQKVLEHLYPSQTPFKKGHKILIKPNLLAPKPPEKAVTTHPDVIHALIRAFKDLGCILYIGDNTPIFNQFHTIQKTQFGPLLEKYGIKHYRFQNFKEVTTSSGRFRFQIPQDFNQFHHVINTAKLKTHSMMLTTLCVKNMFGCITTPQRIHFHFQADIHKIFFARMLLELYELLTPTLNVLDGIVVQEGNGPSSGTPRFMGLLAVSENGIALDYYINRAFNFSYPNPLNQVIEEEYSDRLEKAAFPWLKPEDFPLSSTIPPEYYEKNTLSFQRGIAKRVYQYLFMSRPVIDKTLCVNCRQCIKHCPVEAINNERNINYWQCIRCYCCQELCPYTAVKTQKPRIGFGGR